MALARALLLASSMLVLNGIGSAHAAQKVGVAAAVNPDAFASGKVVNLGKSIFFNEQVKTGANGLVQVLLVDGSTFTVGPNSNLVIDKFVYDPARGQGEMVATFSKGALRFVGGKLSKKEGGVTVNTPQGALAIRGGIAQIQVSVGGSKFLFDFGDRMQLQGNDGQTHTIFQPGNLIDITGGSPFVRPTNPEDTQYFLTQLTSKPGQSGGAGQGGGPTDGQAESGMGNQGAGGSAPPPVGNEIKNQIFTVKIEDATSDKIEQEIVEQIADTPPPVVTGDLPPPPPPVGDPPPPPVVDPPPPPPPLGPLQVQLRVLSSPEFFTSFPGGPDQQEFPRYSYGEFDWSVDPGDRGILGGDDDPDITADDFEKTATIVGGALQGSVQLVEHDYSDCDHSECQPAKVLGPVQQFAFSYEPANGDHAAVGIVFREEGDQFVIDDAFVGTQVSRPKFLAYQTYHIDVESLQVGDNGLPVIDPQELEIDFDDPLLIIAGEEYVLPTQGKLHEISLRTDPRENQGGSIEGDNGFVVPFASAEHTPKTLLFPLPASFDPLTDDPDDLPQPGEIPNVSNLLLLERDGGIEDQSQSVWLQTSFYIGTNSESGEQENFIVLALGGLKERSLDGENFFPALEGERRGGSMVDGCDDGCMDFASFSGGLATLAGGGGAHLMGSQGANLVIGSDSAHVDPETGEGHDISIDRLHGGNESDHQYATYHIGTQDKPAQSVDQGDESYTVKGFATGIWTEYALDEYGDVSGGPYLTSLGNPEPEPYGNDPANVTDSVSITFNPIENTLSAEFALQTGGGVDATFAFGGGAGRSAYIDERRYGAFEASEGTAVDNDNYELQRVESYLVSGDQLGVTEFRKKDLNDPESGEPYDPTKAVFEYTESDGNGGTRRPFCEDCDFIKWGAWGSRLKADQVEGDGGADTNIHLGWWVAGDVSTPQQLNALAADNKTANYAGNAIGTVLNGSNQYVAAGDLAVSWSFAQRSGQLDIRNFDGHSFGGAISQPNPAVNAFHGPEIIGSGLSGSARGAFVNDSMGNPARGVIGDFSVGNGQGYSATGIFAGSGTPIPGQSH